MNKLGIIVNPFSGRDVRRVAARASTSDHHEKQQQVTRLVLGALSTGVDRVFLAHEPFRINERAVENLPEREQVTILRFPLTHSAKDTLTMARLMWEEGCRVFIVLGGDGTSRIVSSEFTDATLLPLSTGTNNVFPYRLEASVAGMAAGLVAAGIVDPNQECLRCKRILVSTDRVLLPSKNGPSKNGLSKNGSSKNGASKNDASIEDIALVDAILLENDFMGSLLPFEADNLRTLVLTRAEPASIGMSPIGGYLLPCGHQDDFAVVVECGSEAESSVTVPLSPGLHARVGIRGVRRIEFGEEVQVHGPGILAFDGDRSISLGKQETATLRVMRDGPRIIETEHIMRFAAMNKLLPR